MFRAAAVWAVAALAAGIVAALLYEPTEDDGPGPFTADDLRALLRDDLDPIVVDDAVDGFTSATLARGDDGCDRIRFRMATTMDNLELNEALSLWVESQPRAAVETADGDGVTLRRCP